MTGAAPWWGRVCRRRSRDWAGFAGLAVVVSAWSLAGAAWHLPGAARAAVPVACGLVLGWWRGRAAPPRCGCAQCACRLTVRRPSEATALVTSWLHRHRDRRRAADTAPEADAADPARRTLVRVVWPRPHPAAVAVGPDEEERRWARGVLLSWVSWHPGVQQVDAPTAGALEELARRAGWPFEHCAVPGGGTELEVLLSLARFQDLGSAAGAARATVDGLGA